MLIPGQGRFTTHSGRSILRKRTSVTGKPSPIGVSPLGRATGIPSRAGALLRLVFAQVLQTLRCDRYDTGDIRRDIATRQQRLDDFRLLEAQRNPVGTGAQSFPLLIIETCTETWRHRGGLASSVRRRKGLDILLRDCRPAPNTRLPVFGGGLTTCAKQRTGRALQTSV
jgi:hypothetical protein